MKKRAAAWSSCVTPPRIRPGDTVAVVAPAGPIPVEGVKEGLSRLASRYRVIYDDGLFAKSGYLAGDDARRAEELNRALTNPDLRAVIAARGGYGVMRILDLLDADALRRDPKIVVGFSDLTAMLSWCVADAQVRPIHGPMVVQLGKLAADDVAWLWRVLEDAELSGPVPSERMKRTGAGGGGALQGRVVGGNLEIVTRLVGTPWELDLGASIFFCEDVGERPYRVDRMLTPLKLAGSLDGVRAVAVGDFTRCDDPDGGPTVEAVVRERLETFDLPALSGLPVGHGERNVALPLGARGVLDLGQGQLVLEEAGVA